MTELPGCDKPITSATEMTLWWAALLPTDVSPSMSMIWLDAAGRMVGRVLCVNGIPLAPSRVAVRALIDVHDAVVAREPAAQGHRALMLCRPGAPEVTEADDEWAEALDLELEDRTDGAWGLHLAAGGGLHVDLLDAAIALRGQS